MSSAKYCVYILKCFRPGERSLFYTGYTKNIKRRLHEHRTKQSNFTSKFSSVELVYIEYMTTKKQSILREKTIKKLSRKKKIQLIKENDFVRTTNIL